MERIELTEKEIFLIKQHLEDSGYFAKKGEMIMLVNRMYSPEDGKALSVLIEKADKLGEVDNYDGQMEEWHCDLLLWYYKQYLAQGNPDVIGLRK